MLAAVGVKKKESKVNHHIIFHLSNAYDAQKRPSLRNPTVSHAEIEDILHDRDFDLKNENRGTNRYALVAGSGQSGGTRGGRGSRNGEGKRGGGGTQGGQSSSGGTCSSSKSGRGRSRPRGKRREDGGAGAPNVSAAAVFTSSGSGVF